MLIFWNYHNDNACFGNFTSVEASEILLPSLSAFGKGSTPSFLPLIQSSKVVVELLAFHIMGRLDHGSMLGLKLHQYYTHNKFTFKKKKKKFLQLVEYVDCDWCNITFIGTTVDITFIIDQS